MTDKNPFCGPLKEVYGKHAGRCASISRATANVIDLIYETSLPKSVKQDLLFCVKTIRWHLEKDEAKRYKEHLENESERLVKDEQTELS